MSDERVPYEARVPYGMCSYEGRVPVAPPGRGQQPVWSDIDEPTPEVADDEAPLGLLAGRAWYWCPTCERVTEPYETNIGDVSATTVRTFRSCEACSSPVWLTAVGAARPAAADLLMLQVAAAGQVAEGSVTDEELEAADDPGQLVCDRLVALQRRLWAWRQARRSDSSAIAWSGGPAPSITATTNERLAVEVTCGGRTLYPPAADEPARDGATTATEFGRMARVLAVVWSAISVLVIAAGIGLAVFVDSDAINLAVGGFGAWLLAMASLAFFWWLVRDEGGPR